MENFQTLPINEHFSDFVYGVSGCERVALKLVSLGADYTLRDNHDECYLDYLIKDKNLLLCRLNF